MGSRQVNKILSRLLAIRDCRSQSSVSAYIITPRIRYTSSTGTNPKNKLTLTATKYDSARITVDICSECVWSSVFHCHAHCTSPLHMHVPLHGTPSYYLILTHILYGARNSQLFAADYSIVNCNPDDSMISEFAVYYH